MDIDIFRLRPNDIDLALLVERDCFPEPLTPDDFKVCMFHGICFVAKEEELVTGYLLTEKVLDECHIIRIAVRENYRRRGIGRAMMEKLFAEAGGEGIKKFYLEVRVSSSFSREFYKKTGFIDLYTRKKYYADNGEDAIFMEKVI